ncbi:MAG: D-ribose pyranase [Candidatus Marinimicrobia bacterium]|nr:D-ribose pyranase [Candidatus Neomarinimicrobiota bacterium]
MKKIGTLNSQLSRIIASMGHKDKLVICDSGLPIPRDAEIVDLALRKNLPGFIETLEVILEELQVEGAIVAQEMKTISNGLMTSVQDLMPGVDFEEVPHERFKQLTRDATQNGNIAFVRTGEATPYANIVLISGVTFP